MTKKVLTRFVRVAFMASAGLPLIFASNAFAQLPAPAVPGVSPAPQAEVERVIVTGSNIPTSEETGPIQWTPTARKTLRSWASVNPTDLTTFIPQEAGGTVNQNMPMAVTGPSTQPARLAAERNPGPGGWQARRAGAIFFGVDIQLIPFPMIDRIDILKDGASAVYGADAVAGVVNIFLIHKFRGLEIGGTYGNTNMGASNDMGEWEAWLKAGTGDDKTDIVMIADVYTHRWPFSAVTATLLATGIAYRLAD